MVTLLGMHGLLAHAGSLFSTGKGPELILPLFGALSALQAKARTVAMMLRVDAALRDRARAGRYAYVHDRGPDFAAGIWVVDPLFMLDALHDAVTAAGHAVGARHLSTDHHAAARLPAVRILLPRRQHRRQQRAWR